MEIGDYQVFVTYPCGTEVLLDSYPTRYAAKRWARLAYLSPTDVRGVVVVDGYGTVVDIFGER